MSQANYPACLAFTLKWEGGYANHPKDPGGATMKGIIQRVYDGYRKRKGQALQSVRRISDDEVAAIYRKQYWEAVRGDDLPDGVDLAVWDFGVNSGPSRAARYLQGILGVKQDGAIGEVTLAAVERHDPGELAAQLCDARLAFVRQLRTWPTFGRGWQRRIDAARTLASGMAEEHRHPAVRPSLPKTGSPNANEPQGKAEGPVAVTKQDGFFTKVTTLIGSVGAAIAGFVQGLDWRVGVAAVVVVGVVVAVVWLNTREDEA